MNLDERIEVLRGLQANVQHMSLALDDVRAIDAYLADEWGIVLATADWEMSCSISHQLTNSGAIGPCMTDKQHSLKPGRAFP